MPLLMISKCCEEILEDPSLWWLFSEEEWRSICKFPFLGTLQFWIVLGRLFAHVSSPSMWEQARVEFISGSVWKISGEIFPMAVLITNEVEEGSLGMVTTFCYYDQAKVESLEMLSILQHRNFSKLSVVVVKIFSNSPYLHWGSSNFFYLHATILSLGTWTTQFPLDQLCL